MRVGRQLRALQCMRAGSLLLILIGTFSLRIQKGFADANSFEVFDRRSGSTITCKKVESIWEPGSVSKSGKFTSFKNLIKQLNTRMQRNSKKREALQSQIKVLTKNLKAQQRLCTKAASTVPSPTPTPNGDATPKPTPTPAGCAQSCFNSSRTTQCFNIPLSVSGSETRGMTLWNGCSGCHTESSRRNRTYSQIAVSFTTIPQMLPFASDYHAQDIADITAYLNRYNSKQCRTDWP